MLASYAGLWPYAPPSPWGSGMSRFLSPVPPARATLHPLPVMKASLFNEFKRTTSVKTVLQFSTTDLTVQQQLDAVYKYFHGKSALVSQVEKFMDRVGNYGNL